MESTLKLAGIAAGLATGIAVSATVGLVTPVSAAEAQNANTVITDYIGTLPDASADLEQSTSAPYRILCQHPVILIPRIVHLPMH